VRGAALIHVIADERS